MAAECPMCEERVTTWTLRKTMVNAPAYIKQVGYSNRTRGSKQDDDITPSSPPQ
jgi:hypothetical protein